MNTIAAKAIEAAAFIDEGSKKIVVNRNKRMKP